MTNMSECSCRFVDDATSSLRVIGTGCTATLCGGPDLSATSGWSVQFGAGDYTTADMLNRGAANDQLSSFTLAAGTDGASNLPFAASLVGYWSFDDLVTDMSGHGLHFAGALTPTFVGGVVNAAIRVDASMIFTVSDSGSSALDVAAVTLMAWVMPTDNDGTQVGAQPTTPQTKSHRRPNQRHSKAIPHSNQTNDKAKPAPSLATN